MGPDETPRAVPTSRRDMFVTVHQACPAFEHSDVALTSAKVMLVHREEVQSQSWKNWESFPLCTEPDPSCGAVQAAHSHELDAP